MTRSLANSKDGIDCKGHGLQRAWIAERAVIAEGIESKGAEGIDCKGHRGIESKGAEGIDCKGQRKQRSRRHRLQRS